MSPAAPGRRSRPERTTRTTSERHLHVVEPPGRRFGRLVLPLGLAVVVIAVLFGATMFHVRLATGQRHIDELGTRAAELREDYDRLRLRVDELSAPARIVERARSLGMVEATDVTWLAPGPTPVEDRIADDPPTLHDYLDVKPYLRDDR